MITVNGIGKMLNDGTLIWGTITEVFDGDVLLKIPQYFSRQVEKTLCKDRIFQLILIPFVNQQDIF